ncbi:MAG: hypothetical protein MJK14_06175 [Rivularia sp. ALOHA_DT_140]|nr:hypothetical protein [Rivularia sp. ALOHA_DT_140]
MSQYNNLEIIANCLRRVRNAVYYIGISSLAGTIIFTAIGLNSKKPSSAIIGLGSACAITTLISGCLALKHGRITYSEIYQILKDSPEKIVWVYQGGINYKVNGIKTSSENIICIHLDNGRCLQLRSIPAQDVESVLSAIQQQAPQAIYGYSEDIKLKYLQNPKSLSVNSEQ